MPIEKRDFPRGVETRGGGGGLQCESEGERGRERETETETEGTLQSFRVEQTRGTYASVDTLLLVTSISRDTSTP